MALIMLTLALIVFCGGYFGWVAGDSPLNSLTGAWRMLMPAPSGLPNTSSIRHGLTSEAVRRRPLPMSQRLRQRRH